MNRYNPLMDVLNNEIPIHIIGDVKKVSNAQDAIKDTYGTTTEI